MPASAAGKAFLQTKLIHPAGNEPSPSQGKAFPQKTHWFVAFPQFPLRTKLKHRTGNEPAAMPQA